MFSAVFVLMSVEPQPKGAYQIQIDFFGGEGAAALGKIDKSGKVQIVVSDRKLKSDSFQFPDIPKILVLVSAKHSWIDIL